MPGPTPDTVYVAGDFTKINGMGPNHIQLLNVNTGLAVTSFKAPSTNGGIETMELLPGNRLFIGGFFTKIGGVDHGQLATLNATTGALDPFMDITVSGHTTTPAPARRPRSAPASPGSRPRGDRLVVVGNFRTVGGLARDQIVMIDLTGATAAVATNWYTTRYTPICSPDAFDSYMRDVEMSPDGSFFVVATTGGPHSGTLCDTAARFETYAVGTALTPDLDRQLGRRHPVGRRGHPVGRLRRRAPALDEQPQRRRPRRPGRRAAARPGRARPADRHPAEVEPGPQPAR